jgi:hypothetical protein
VAGLGIVAKVMVCHLSSELVVGQDHVRATASSPPSAIQQQREKTWLSATFFNKALLKV